jgi:predicted permease
VVVVLAMVGLALLLARWRGVPRDERNCLAMTSMMYNSGNYGLPLQDLAFRPFGLGPEAILLQTFVLLTQNVTGFTLGVFLAASGRERVSLGATLRQIRRFPPIYALAAGAATVILRELLGEHADVLWPWLAPFRDALGYAKQAFIAVALFTLGAQLGLLKKEAARTRIGWAVVLRLVGGPAVALLLVQVLGLEGFVAQLLFIGAATPTAVNCLLLCMEFDNHPDLAARMVLYTTLLSPVTITLVIFLARSGWMPALVIP